MKGWTEEERKDVFGGFQRRGPAFLEGVDEEVKKQFGALFKDRSIPRSEKKAKFDELAEKTLTGKNLEEYKKHSEKRAEFKAKWEAKVGSLSI